MRFHHHYPICLFLSIVLISFTGCKKKDMSLKLNEPRNIKGVISYKRSFGDLNDMHLKAGSKSGNPPACFTGRGRTDERKISADQKQRTLQRRLTDTLHSISHSARLLY